MFSGPQFAAELTALGITHVIWLPDTALGPWEAAIENEPSLMLIRICREGEAWAIAAGLHLAGKRPLVVIQNTGLFESGDSMRNALFDFGLPLFAVIGYRSYLIADSPDTARRFTEPILQAWDIEYVLVESADTLGQFAEHYRDCQAKGTPGVALIAEGRM